jgi:hypothetical protein
MAKEAGGWPVRNVRRKLAVEALRQERKGEDQFYGLNG